MNKFLLSMMPPLIFLAVLLSACGNPVEEVKLATPTAVQDSEPDHVQVGLPPYTPEELVKELKGIEEIFFSDTFDGADLRIDVSADNPFADWIYVFAAPFPYLGNGVEGAVLKAFWEGKKDTDFPGDILFIDGGTKAVIEKIWGPASAVHVKVEPERTILSMAWEAESAFALLPFERLAPGWKVLAIDGINPISKGFESSAYLLTVPFSFLGEQSEIDELEEQISEDNKQISLTNRREDRLTTVVMTGVTALVRGTAYVMETSGYTYPQIDIGDILRGADILHISNEIPFTETCPNPFVNRTNDANLIFCSKPEYIHLLEAIGTDVVELTGDHFRDWGPEAMLYTLSMYTDREWQYYGGGRDLSDAIRPALFTHNGNKIAFLGCNGKQPGYATASETSPGAVYCDMELMAEQVQDAVSKDYLPIFTFQHVEYYSYDASPALEVDFYAAADAGAVIVSGSQAHQPHALEFYKSSLLHYGLGNLFFDQYKESFSQRQAFIDRHVFYDGRHISTELIPIIFIDLARPRLMTEEERTNLLNTVFTASGW